MKQYRHYSTLIFILGLLLLAGGCQPAALPVNVPHSTAVSPLPPLTPTANLDYRISLDPPTQVILPQEEAAPPPPPAATKKPPVTRQPAETTQKYVRPLPGTPNHDWFIGNYMDANRQPSVFADYRGGFMTYDQHSGIDFILGDTGQMEAGVPVLAVRSGVVLQVRDGQYDKEFNLEGGQISNLVKILHDDGSTAVYKHLKAGSTLVIPGQSVHAGDPLAQVGSSGLSTHPHLHLEVRDAQGKAIDLLAADLLDLDEAYPARPFLFDAGISGSTDPRIFSNYFRYTPDHRNYISSHETLYVWYKLINFGQGDAVHALLVHPDGSTSPLYTIQAEDNRKFDSYFIYANNLEPGYHRVLIYLNDQSNPIKDLPLIVEN